MLIKNFWEIEQIAILAMHNEIVFDNLQLKRLFLLIVSFEFFQLSYQTLRYVVLGQVLERVFASEQLAQNYTKRPPVVHGGYDVIWRRGLANLILCTFSTRNKTFKKLNH